MAEEKKEIVANLQPVEVDFACPDCGQNCKLHPRAQPMNVVHSLPICEAWRAVGTPDQVKAEKLTQWGARAKETTFDFLRRAKLPVLGGLKF